MNYLGRAFAALLLCLAVRAPGWAQQSPPPTSPIQKLIAVDQLLEEKEYDDALRGYHELLASDPNNAQILNRIGNTYQALQRLRDAKKYYDRALKADPKFAAAVNNIGCLYYNERRYGTAARQYRRAIKMDSSVASFQSPRPTARWATRSAASNS
jgi:tetratricopeptide (TPR) repeat protein